MELVLNTLPATEVANKILKKLQQSYPKTKSALLSSLMEEFKEKRDILYYFMRKDRFFDHICPVLHCFNESYVNRYNNVYGIHTSLLAMGLIFSNVILTYYVQREHDESTILKLYQFIYQVIRTGDHFTHGVNPSMFNFELFMQDHNRDIPLSYFPKIFFDICRNVQILYVKIQPIPAPISYMHPSSAVMVSNPVILDSKPHSMISSGMGMHTHFIGWERGPSLMPLSVGLNRFVGPPRLLEDMKQMVSESHRPLSEMKKVDVEEISSFPKKIVSHETSEEIFAPPASVEAVAPVVPVEAIALAPLRVVEERPLYDLPKLKRRLDELMDLDRVLKSEIPIMENEFQMNQRKIRQIAGL
jgi:hypothetical protein